MYHVCLKRCRHMRIHVSSFTSGKSEHYFLEKIMFVFLNYFYFKRVSSTVIWWLEGRKTVVYLKHVDRLLFQRMFPVKGWQHGIQLVQIVDEGRVDFGWSTQVGVDRTQQTIDVDVLVDCRHQSSIMGQLFAILALFSCITSTRLDCLVYTSQRHNSASTRDAATQVQVLQQATLLNKNLN